MISMESSYNVNRDVISSFVKLKNLTEPTSKLISCSYGNKSIEM